MLDRRKSAEKRDEAFKPCAAGGLYPLVDDESEPFQLKQEAITLAGPSTMKRRNCVFFVLAALLAFAHINAVGQVSTYPNSTAGLQQQLSDIMKAHQQQNETRVGVLIQNFVLPNIDEWAAVNLPETYRANLVTKYNLAAKVFEASLLGQMNRMGSEANSSITVSSPTMPAAIPATTTELMTLAGASPYRIEFSAEGFPPGKMIETFFYDQGAFRFAGHGIFPFWVAPPRGFRAEGTVPRAIYSPNASYSEEARKKKIQGSVAIAMTVGTDGLPHDLVVKNGSPALADAALDTVRRWKFVPAEEDGQPVEYPLIVTVRFTLQ